MSSIQISLIAGAIIGIGLVIIISRLVPATPDLRAFLDNLSSTESTITAVDTQAGAANITDQIGLWLMRTLPTGWLIPARSDLAILRKPLYRFYGEKAVFGLVGLVLPLAIGVLATATAALFGFSIPIYIPIGVSLLTAVGLSFLPDYNLRDDAKQARTTFRRALTTYVDLISMQRRSNRHPRQALESAATAANSWVLQRLQEALTRSKLTGDYPWDALTKLGKELDVPDLIEIADIMRLAGDDHAAVYDQLRARSQSMRDALRAEDLSAANAAGVRVNIPMATLGMIFVAFMGVPVLIRLFAAF